MVNDVPIAPVEREPKDALAQLLVDDVRDEREVLQVARSLGQPQGGVPCELNGLGSNHQHVAELPLALSDARILGVFDLRPPFPHSFELRSPTFSLSQSVSLSTSRRLWNFSNLHMTSSPWRKKYALMVSLVFVGGSQAR